MGYLDLALRARAECNSTAARRSISAPFILTLLCVVSCRAGAAPAGDIPLRNEAAADEPVLTLLLERDLVLRPAAAPAIAVRPDSSRKWELRTNDRTLRSAMARWAGEAEWQLLWELPADFSIDINAALTGSFEESVEVVVRSMAKTGVPMAAVFYQGNRVLRIIAKGSE